MRTRITAVLFALSLVSLVTLSNAPRAQAQCAIIRAFNFTGCDLGLCLYDAGGNVACITIRAVGGPFIFAFVAPFTPVGVVSAAKNNYPFAGSPLCTPCIMLPGASVPTGCCAQVCYDPVLCTITVNPCGPPCLP